MIVFLPRRELRRGFVQPAGCGAAGPGSAGPSGLCPVPRACGTGRLRRSPASLAPALVPNKKRLPRMPAEEPRFLFCQRQPVYFGIAHKGGGAVQHQYIGNAFLLHQFH